MKRLHVLNLEGIRHATEQHAGDHAFQHDVDAEHGRLFMRTTCYDTCMKYLEIFCTQNVSSS